MNHSNHLAEREAAYEAWLSAHRRASSFTVGDYQERIELCYQADLLRIAFLKIVEKQNQEG